MTPEDAPPPSVEAPQAGRRRGLRREEIVAVAKRLFAERGYEGTSMGDLAECVGLRKASLFHHFESKDALYARVLGDLLDPIAAALAGIAVATGSYEARLDALTDAILSILAADPHTARLLVREAMDWGPVMRERLSMRIQAVLTSAVEFVAAGQRDGAFNPALDPRQFVISMAGIHVFPFLIDRSVQELVGESPFAPAFVAERQRSVREQVRLMLLSRAPR